MAASPLLLLLLLQVSLRLRFFRNRLSAIRAHCDPNSKVHRARMPTRRQAGDRRHADARIDDPVARADAVMLSAESASGRYPVEAVATMDRIITEVELDPHYREMPDASADARDPTVVDAICASLRQVAALLPVAAMVTYTRSGWTGLRAAHA